MSAPSIRAEGLGKRYRTGVTRRIDSLKEALTSVTLGRWRRREPGARPGDFWALRDVSFELRPGEIVGILGPNGAGKSTLLKLLARITEPTEGRAELRGRLASLLEVGTGFHPELTGRENVYLGGAIMGMSRREVRGRLDEIVEFAGIARFFDTPVKRYSSGMYTRLAFAVAAHVDPDILIVDEVLAVGDLGFQQRCLAKMRDAVTCGRTLLFVSHHVATIASLTQRCLLIQGGRLVADGDTRVVAARYQESVGHALFASDLRRAMRRDGLAAVRPASLVGVRIDTAGGLLRVGDPLTVELEIAAYEDVDDAALLLRVMHPSGLNLLTARSERDRFRVSLSRGSAKTVRVALDLHGLAHGVYQLELGLYVDAGRWIDSIPRALQFEIQPRVDEPDELLAQGTGLLVPGAWCEEGG